MGRFTVTCSHHCHCQQHANKATVASTTINNNTTTTSQVILPTPPSSPHMLASTSSAPESPVFANHSEHSVPNYTSLFMPSESQH